MEKIPTHTHNGTDSPRIKSGDVIPVVRAVPTHDAKEGTVVLYTNATDYKIYVRINNLWKSVSLT